MAVDYETGRAALKSLARDFEKEGLEAKRNEATTRLHLINRLLFECLGWERTNCSSEDSHDGQYADYTLYVQKPRRALIVEAKKQGIYFELPAGHTKLEYPLTSLQRDDARVFKAVAQAVEYCQRRGVPIGAVCNGHQVVCFLASRVDGAPPLEGKAIVFDSFESMTRNFFQLWQYLSKSGVSERKLSARLLGDETPVLPARLATTVYPYPGFKNRNKLQTELQTLSDLVIEDISKDRDLEPEFIKECYCSSGALSQYATVSKSILEQRYAALFDEEYDHPGVEAVTDKKGITSEMVAASLSSRPILLIGDVGVGKTMFIRYLMKVAAAEVLENAISLYIDLGSKASLTTDHTGFILQEIRTQLLEDYHIDVEDRNLVRGVYHGELQRFARGIYSDLKATNPDLYKQKEIEFLEQKLQEGPEHLKQCFVHISKGRKKQVVLFIDNVDQRDYQLQQDAFLIAQEITTNWPVTVFLTIRPQTFHRSKKLGALSGYHVKAFTISPPRIDDVLIRRLEFAKKITSGKVGPKSLPESISIRLPSLQSYIDVLLWSFSKNKELIEFIDNVSYGDIRLALDFVKTFIGSGHVNTEEILKAEERHKSQTEHIHYLVPLHHFIRAVIFGDGVYYNPQSSSIANLFDLTNPDGREHFLLPILILYVNHAADQEGSDGFLHLDKVYEYLQSIGYTPLAIDKALNRSSIKRLIETEARKILQVGDDHPQMIRATPVGVYHATMLIRQFSYVDAMIIDTPILDEGFRSKIVDEENIADRLRRARIFCQYLTMQWSSLGNRELTFNWPTVNQHLQDAINEIEARISQTSLPGIRQ